MTEILQEQVIKSFNITAQSKLNVGDEFQVQLRSVLMVWENVLVVATFHVLVTRANM
jgi:hypothetical protein